MANDWTGERLETFVFNEATIEHLHRYALAKEFVKDKITLDIACGEGYGTHILAEEAASITGVDIDPQTIDAARRKYQQPNLSFLEGSVENIPCPSRSFDIVLSFETLEHTTEHKKMLAEIKRVLKPGGLLIISTPDKKTYSDIPGSYINPYHKKELYQTEFEELLAGFFDYRLLLSQDLFISSVILNVENKYGPVYRGNYSGVRQVGSIDPLYLIAFCSDKPVSPVTSSFFISKSIFEKILDNRETAIKNSVTYKIGYTVLFPVKIIRKLFSRFKKGKHG